MCYIFSAVWRRRRQLILLLVVVEVILLIVYTTFIDENTTVDFLSPKVNSENQGLTWDGTGRYAAPVPPPWSASNRTAGSFLTNTTPVCRRACTDQYARECDNVNKNYSHENTVNLD